MKTNLTSPVSARQAEARQGDGLLVILQDNAAKTLTIHRMNAVAEAMLGYAEEAPLGQDFATILGVTSTTLLEEEIDYKDDAPDLGEVLSRQRELRLKTKSGQEITVKSTINRLMSEGMNACFQLVIPDEREVLAEQKIRDFIALNLEGHMVRDAVTGLPDRATAMAFLPLLQNYLSESGMEVSFAVLRLDRHAKSIARYGAENCTKLLQHTVNCCIASFRSADIVFVLSDHTLGLVLFDISRESARVVFNRLRWNIRSHRISFGNKADFTVTTTLAFDMIDAVRDGNILERCEAAVGAVEAESRNGLVELGS